MAERRRPRIVHVPSASVGPSRLKQTTPAHTATPVYYPRVKEWNSTGQRLHEIGNYLSPTEEVYIQTPTDQSSIENSMGNQTDIIPEK